MVKIGGIFLFPEKVRQAFFALATAGPFWRLYHFQERRFMTARRVEDVVAGVSFVFYPFRAFRSRLPVSDVIGRVRVRGFAFLLAMILGLVLPLGQASALPAPVPQRADVIMIGDRLVDVAYNLGVLPEGMSVRCSLWPICDTLKGSVQVLGCPNCTFKKKAEPVIKFAQQRGIRRVLIEKSDPFCTYVPNLQLEKMVPMLEDKGFEVEFVDFTRGLEDAVRQTALLLGRGEKTDALLMQYDKAMKETRKKMAGKQFAKKVLIIRGTYQAATGKTFLRVETAGGYADRFLLKPMGIENVGGLVVPAKKKSSKGHIAIRKLDGLAAAAPDAIVMTGDAVAVQKAIAEAVAKNPALARVPAIQTHSLYSLPGYIDSSVVEYPQILRKWADVLAR